MLQGFNEETDIVVRQHGVDRRLLEMGQVYRLSGWEAFRAIVIPSTIPHLVAGMKVGFGLALKVSVVAEIFGVTSGIGYVMNYSREILATQMVFVWALVMIAIMMLTDKLVFESLTRRLERWRVWRAPFLYHHRQDVLAVARRRLIHSSSSATTGTWSDGSFPLRSSRSIHALVQRSASGAVA